MGEPRIRPVPNSSTSPASTLNGVPASATSSPITNTVSSRRSSSARASLTAWANVSVRVSTLSEDILGDLARFRERRFEREGKPGLDLRARLCRDRLQLFGSRELLLFKPRTVHRERVAFAAPPLLFLLGA